MLSLSMAAQHPQPRQAMDRPPNWSLKALFNTPFRAVTSAALAGVSLYVSGVATYLGVFTDTTVPLPVYFIPAAALLPLLKWAAKPAPGASSGFFPVISRARKRRYLLQQRALFIRRLTPSAAARYNMLQNSVQQLESFYPPRKRGSLLRPGEYLLWLYLKLLLARDHLEINTLESQPAELRRQLAALEGELQEPELTPTARSSKEETSVLLRQRLSAVKSRPARIQEVESDLTRIEHKIALLHDEAVRHDPLSASGLRIFLPLEILNLQSLEPSGDGGMERLDGLMTAQLSAH